MNLKETGGWAELLRHPGITEKTTGDELYRAACIGAVTLLYEAGDTAALAESARHAASPESRARALFALQSLTRAQKPIRQQALRELYVLAIRDGNSEAAAFLLKCGMADEDPGWNSAGLLLFGKKHQLLKADPGPEKLSELFLKAETPLRVRLLTLAEKVLPNWAVLMRFLNEPQNHENREKLLDAYESFAPDERALIRFCRDTEGSEALSAAADLLLRSEDGKLRDFCLETGAEPSDTSQAALYYFLSGQWEKYDASDSDYRLIRIAYEQGNPVLQRRLITISRESGNSAWLRQLSSSPDSVPNSGTLSDQHLLVKSLIEQRQWKRLWEILPNVPMLCMPEICRGLTDAGFTPALPDESAFLKELTEKIEAARDLSPIPLRRKYTEGSGTAIGMCGGGPYFAVLFNDRRLLAWDIRDESAEPIHITSAHLTFRRAVITHDGKYLCADCGKSGIVVFSLPGGQAVKTIPVPDIPLIGLFLQNGGRRLITLDQNGKGSVYSFPGGAMLASFELGAGDYVRAVWDEQNNYLGGITFEGGCPVYDVSGRRPITMLSPGGAITAVPDAFSRGRIPVIDRDENLSAYNIFSGRAVFDHIPTGSENTRRLAEYAGGELYLLGTLTGQVKVFDPTACMTHAVLNFGSKSAVSGLWYDPEHAILCGCTFSGTVRSWDMSLFNDMIRVLPLMQLPGLNRLDEYKKNYPEPGVKAAADWLKCIISWRRRFDIEVDFGE